MDFWYDIDTPSAEQGECEIASLTVSQVVAHMRQLVQNDSRLANLVVSGEVVGWRIIRGNHAVFTLRDEQSQIGCVMWSTYAREVDDPPSDGEQVYVFGSIRNRKYNQTYTGEFQIHATKIIRRFDKGYWWKQYEETKRKLEVEGLFSEHRKRPLPPFPQRVGLITSIDGAVLHDVIQIARKRNPSVEIFVFPSLVQGEHASESLVRAIRFANSFGVEQPDGSRCMMDVLILARGGGSIEDLWAFNTEQVVRAVATSRIPIVSAIGHETDYTLTDFAADLRAPTPSAAVEMVLPDAEHLLAKVDYLSQRAYRAVESAFATARNSLAMLSERGVFTQPESLLNQARQRVNSFSIRLESASNRFLERNKLLVSSLLEALYQNSPQARLARYREQLLLAALKLDASSHSLNTLTRRLEVLTSRLSQAANLRAERHRNTLVSVSSKLDILNPYAVLQRGYALLRDPFTKHVLSQTKLFVPGQTAEVVLSDGILLVTVEEVKGDASA
ncbi:MAG: exodeoxyribonuclease VII large subunit [Fimbriimonadales bacterium]|nr:exodeoxyribonuclease VII large subunit [Fimbriimonadales bacterium]